MNLAGKITNWVLRAAAAAAISVLAIGAVQAADRRAIVTEGTDFFGRDIETLKDVSIDDCEKACVSDQACKAFTYNIKARWCFKKADFGELRQFAGAISGRIVEGPVVSPELEATRTRELTFVPKDGIDAAKALLTEIEKLPVEGTLDEALERAVSAAMANNPIAASDAYRSAIRMAPERFDLWEAFASASVAATSNDYTVLSRVTSEAVNGSIMAYLRSTDDSERARALALVANAYAKQEVWRRAIKAARAALAIEPNGDLEASLDIWVSQYGFRITGNNVDTDAEIPRICVTFSDAIASERPNITDYISISGGEKLSVEAEPNQICATGIEYGKRYVMTVRAGLPALDPDEEILKTSDIEFYIRDRDAQVRFVGKAYVLPRHDDASIPVVSVNVDTIRAEVVRIGDRSLVNAVGESSFLTQMGSWETEDIAERRGERVWTGTVGIARETNKEVTTAIPMGEIVKTLKPGVYAMSAWSDTDDNSWGQRATQWFIITDIGISSMTGNDGLHVVLRSLNTAGAVEGATLSLIARNNEILGTATSNADGYARFDPGLARGTGGNSPALLTVTGKDGDYAFLDLTTTAFDLTDRGVEGRPSPEPVDVFTTTERGIYRPGETVHITTLMRDAAARSATDLPMTLVLIRPDGVEQVRRLVADEGEGGRDVSLDLPAGAMRGTWRADVYTDPKGDVLSSAEFLVEDFVPERVDFDFDLPSDRLAPGDEIETSFTVNWLYGAPAANLPLEGEVYVTAASSLPYAPGFRFGIEGEEFSPVAEPITADPTAEDGSATAYLSVPDVSGSTLPLQAAVHIRVLDTNGRPVERRKSVTVADDRTRIGLKPLFDYAVGEGENAAFEVALFDAEGNKVEAKGLTWTLSRIDTRYQWYNSEGSWNYEPIRNTRRMADGSVDVAADGTAKLDLPVEWGEYQISLEDPEGVAIPVTASFEAGWYVPPSADAAPDLLKVSLDKPKYAIGDTVTARIHPRFPGIAVVSVVDDRLIAMKTVEVGEDGATVDFPVTSEWGPGAYVTATLLRPMDVAAKRMPARALGLAWATVDPGDRVLDVKINVPAEHKPRTDLPIEVALANVTPGEEAYVTIAAVDVGILNLTSFKTPAPDEWYFAQRQLGIEFRDAYGRLIDTMLGAKGTVKSGGDGTGISRLTGTPPVEQLVAFYQGVTKVDADGKVRANFSIPDFNGSVRVMAIAWSKTAVGHAEAEVLVRDPVVVQASLPNFLAPGDTTRLRLDITHVQGPTGIFKLAVTAAGSLVEVGPGADSMAVEVADKASVEVLVPLEAKSVGDETITVALTLPDGVVLTKTLTMPVRANEPPVLRSSEVALAAGNGRLTVDADLLSDFVPGTATATVTVGGVGGIDLPGLVRSLDKYPYGCSEQITSRAMPLVYLDDVVLAAGLTGETPVRDRVQKAIGDLLVNQASNGSFGLWGPGSGDLWLDSYVTDFLTRAKEKGYDVPAVAFDLAVINLKNSIAYATDFTSGGEDIAYALYVLARNGRASIGDLRYYAESKLDAFATPLAKAQLGAALALYGETAKSDTVFRSALGLLADRTDNRGWRSDYGSDLRDGAAILTLASETRSSSVDVLDLSRTIGDLNKVDNYNNTQEQAWMLLAANALINEGRKPEVTVNGKAHSGVLTARYDDAELAAKPVVIENSAGYGVDARITVSGVPVSPEPAGGNGFTITRRYFGLDGAELDPTKVTLGQRMVVVLTVTSPKDQWSRLVIDDPLPAGLVIDNPSLLSGADVSNLNWLTLVNQTARSEFRADRFVSAIDLRGDMTEFSVGYMARAVAPGSYAHPAAIVEDMYRPFLRARTGSGKMDVAVQ